MFRLPILTVSLLLLAWSPTAAQPVEGDLLVTGILGGPSPQHAILAIRPSSGLMRTIDASYQFSMDWPIDVRMAEDNTALMVSESWQDTVGRNTWGTLTRVSGGRVAIQTFRADADIRLDYDGRWVAAGHSKTWTPRNFIYDDEVAGLSGGGTTSYHRVSTTLRGPVGYRQIVIDRDPGAPTYVVATDGPLLYLDRTGLRGTLTTPGPIGAMALDPVSGDYLLLSRGLLVIDKVGRTRRTIATGGAMSLWLNQDRTCWVGKFGSIARIDVATGTVTTVVPLSGGWSPGPRGLTVFGSRRMVCNGSGVPGTTVRVDLSSRRAGDGGQPFAIACSLARRPGFRTMTGDWLALDVTSGLFHLTVNNLAPSVFQGFHGVTDGSGRATARVVIPSNIPRGTGITVFVAGIVYDARGVRTVTNTHWFVLS